MISRFKNRQQRHPHKYLSFEDEFGDQYFFKGGGVTTQQTELDPIQRKALESVIGKSEERFAEGPLEFFPGQTLAGEDPLTAAGQNIQLGQFGNLQDFSGEALQAATRGLNLDLINQPETQRLAEAAVRPIQQRFQEQILPGIQSAAVQQGAFGGSRQDISEAIAAREFGTAALDARSGVLLDAQRAGLDQQARILGLAPQISAGQLFPGQAVQDIGAQRQERGQQEIEAERERFEFGQLAPEEQLDRFASRVTGINLGPTTVQTSKGGGLFGK